MRRPVQAVAALALASTATAGCAGPEARIDYGVKTVKIDVAFGKPDPGSPEAPAGEFVVQPAPSGIGVVPVLVPRSGLPESIVVGGDEPPALGAPPVGPPPCPMFGPDDFPLTEADNRIRTLAPTGTFPYRISGSATASGRTTPISGTLPVTVSDARALSDGRSAFTMRFSVGAVSSRARYEVLPPQQLGNALADRTPQTGQLGLAELESRSAGAPNASFRPAKPLKLLELRAEPSRSWSDSGTDPASATTYAIEGTIQGRDLVNACGRPIDAYKVVATQRVVTPVQNISSTRTLWFATQYGGLLVAEHVRYEGTAGRGATLEDVSGEIRMTIDVDPTEPQR